MPAKVQASRRRSKMLLESALIPLAFKALYQISSEYRFELKKHV